MKHKPTLKTPVDDKTLRAIGKVIVNFAYLEDWVGIAIGHFVGDMEIGVTMHAQFGLKQNIEFLDTLFHEVIEDETTIKRFGEYVRKIREFEEARNRIVHAQWWQESSMRIATTYKSKAKGKKGVVRDHYPITATEMLYLANALPELAMEFSLFVGRASLKRKPKK